MPRRKLDRGLGDFVEREENFHVGKFAETGYARGRESGGIEIDPRGDLTPNVIGRLGDGVMHNGNGSQLNRLEHVWGSIYRILTARAARIAMLVSEITD